MELFYHLSRQRGDHLPWLVCFHGFPTSSWDWHLLLPHLEKSYRVLVFDFPGYGLSAKPPHRDYSLLRQLDAAVANDPTNLGTILAVAGNWPSPTRTQ